MARFNARLELPKCDFENIELEMGTEEKELYAEAFSRGQDVVREVVSMGAGAGRQMELLEALLRVRQVMTWPQLYIDGMAIKEDSDPVLWTHGSRKMSTLLDLIHSHPNEKSLVFTQFMGEMDYIQERLTESGIPVFRIDGSILKERREAEIAGFKGGDKGSVFLIQIKAGGVGLNLQEATRVYITTPAWNPATELQAIRPRPPDRADAEGGRTATGIYGLRWRLASALGRAEHHAAPGGKGQRLCRGAQRPPLATQVPNATKTKITIHALRKF